MKKWFQLGLRQKIFLVSLSTTIGALLAVLIISVSNIINNGTQEILQSSFEKSRLIQNNADQIISNAKYNIKAFSTSSALQTVMTTTYSDDNYGIFLFSSAMRSAITNIMDIDNLVSEGFILTRDFRIYDFSTNSVRTEKTFELSELYATAKSHLGQIVISVDEITGELKFSKALIDIKTGNDIGMLSFNLNRKRFSSIFDSALKPTESMFMVSEENQIIEAEDNLGIRESLKEFIPSLAKIPDESETLTLNNNRYSVFTQKLSEAPIYIFYFSSRKAIFQKAAEGAVMILICGVFIILLSIFLTKKLSKSITTPLVDLAASAEALSKGNFEPIVFTSRNEDEIGTLTKCLNNMMLSIKDMTSRIYFEQNQKREYELQLLQAQINPHFLYNCLDNVNTLISEGNNAQAIGMLGYIGGYYQGILSKGRNVITLAEELELVRNYLQIQRIRNPELFSYHIDMEQRLSHYKCLKMLIQPTVENTVLHGFSRMQKKGFISLTVSEVQNKIVIKVSDNGCGIEEEQLQGIFSGTDPSPSHHFGLKNIQDRIQLRYGNEYGVTITSRHEEGTEVSISFPKVM
ncbi:MAG: histidine kinase [Sphaerochaeta sp.]